MTIEYDLSQDGKRINTYPRGVLDIKETIDYFDRLETDKRVKPGAIEIVYFNYVTDFKISYMVSREITQSYQKPKAIQKIKATIFVCETDLAYGIGRMLQTFHEITNAQHEVSIVRSKRELEDEIKRIN